MKDGKTFFSIDARTVFQLGKEAIESELLAISELVKNSYDADATVCKVIFGKKVESDDDIVSFNQIIIEDNGLGMSFNDMQKNWLRIGTDNKIKDPKSKKFQRRKIGEKGIGRLALNRLGNKVDIYTKKENESIVHFSVNFENFKGGLDLVNVPVLLEKVNESRYFKDNTSGTVIIIDNLCDLWTLKSIDELKEKSMMLQNPLNKYTLDENNNIVLDKNTKISNGFIINFEIEEHGTSDIELEIKEYLENSLFRASIIIDTTKNQWKYTHSFHTYDSMTRLNDDMIVRDYEKIIIDVDDKQVVLEPDDLKLGEIKISLFGYDFSSEVRSMFTHAMGLTFLKNVISNIGGVKVYRDNQRVYNYGEPGSDWLELSSKRVNRPGKFLSNNVLFGSVELDRESSLNLKEKTNREGFIDDKYSQRFVVLVRTAIYRFFNDVEQYKSRIKTQYSKVMKRVREDEIYDRIVTSIDLAQIDNAIKIELKEGIYLYREQMEYIKNVLFNVSINTLDYLNIFHDLENKVDKIRNMVSKQIKDDSINDSFDELELFIKSHNDLIRDKDFKKYIVNTMLDSILFEEKFYLLRNKVILIKDFKGTESVDFEFHRPSIKRIINNIITNSTYWISTNERKLIKIKTIKTEDGIEIIIDDNGPGFNGDIDFLRQPFVTRKLGNKGIGLGLFIIDELMRKSNGEVEYSNNSELEKNGARVRLIFLNRKGKI